MKKILLTALMLAMAAVSCGGARKSVDFVRPVCEEPRGGRVFFPENTTLWLTQMGGSPAQGRIVAETLRLFDQGQASTALQRFVELAEKSDGAFRIACLAAASATAVNSGDMDFALILAQKVNAEATGSDRDARLVRDVIRLSRFAAD